MFIRVITLCCFAAVSLAEKPHLGLNLPKVGDDIGNHIVGGTEATKGEFPYQVSLQYRGRHFCGGVIIDTLWVMTAGHCVGAVSVPSAIVVKCGKHYLNRVEDTEQTLEVTKAFVHEKYTGGVAPYDYALLKLSSHLRITAAVAPLNLPPRNSIPAGVLIFSGWGSVSSTNVPSMPNALQTSKFPVVEINECRKALEALVGPNPLHETNVCTGPLSGGYSACSGDSGGPLVIKKRNGSVEVVGLASWAVMPCGTVGAPSVYARVSAVVDWIKTTMHTN